MNTKALFTIVLILISGLTVFAQYPYRPELRHLEENKRTINPDFKQTVKKGGHYSMSDWRALIDERWGEGLPTAQKLEIFDEFWRRIDEEYACFPNSDVDWDALREKYRPEVATGVSQGRFYAIIDHMTLALQEGHTGAYNEAIYNDILDPGVPLLVGRGIYTSHFGAALTPLPDSSLLVYKVIDSHPMGLELGDRILGYERLPWKSLYKELLSFELPTTQHNYGSSEQSAAHIWLTAAGENWHLFDTIDFIKYGSTDTSHSPTSLLVDQYLNLSFTEQMPVPDIPFPKLENGQGISWGIVEGTNIGYVYTYAISDDYSASGTFESAIKDLVFNHNTDGLIIDIRFCIGGDISSSSALAYLFNEDLYTFGTDKRTDPNDHFGFTTVTSTNLPYPSWPGWSEADKINATPQIYDKPIAILTGPYAHSYGNFLPMKLGFHPYSRTFGKPTNGAFSAWDGTGPPLADGWESYVATYNSYLLEDADHYLTHTVPVVDEEVWLEPDGVARGEDAVVNRAIEWIVNKVYPITIPSSIRYASPGSQLPAEVHLHNPNDHSVMVWAFLKDMTHQKVLDSLPLAAADSNLFSGYIPLPETEVDFSLTFRSTDQDDGEIQELPSVNRFTTMGPITIDHYTITSEDTILNAGDLCTIKLYLKNNGQEATVQNVEIKLSQIDSCATPLLGNTARSIDFLNAGEVKAHNNSFTIKIEEGCVEPSAIPVQVDISRVGNLFWQDTLYLDVESVNTGSKLLIPGKTELHQNYPNPFKLNTIIGYQLISDSRVRLIVYDLTGREIRTLVDSRQDAGQYSLTFEANGIDGGIYIYKLITESFIQSRKMLLHK